jgi:fatty acid desaturase
MRLRTVSSYAREVRPSLPAHAFDAVPSRIAWLTLHIAIIAGGIYAIKQGIGGWWAAPLFAILIGHSFAGCAFVGHETLHGAVVRSRGLRSLIGWLSFVPFTLSPRLWVAWHNKTHHAHTMSMAKDPDCFPTLEVFNRQPLTRAADHVAFAANRRWGFITLLLGFSGQTLQMILRWAKASGVMSARERALAWVETLAGLAVWAAVLVYLGPLKFVVACTVPWLIGNVIVISYILTNHSLSPHTAINDPLVNSLSVTVPRLFAILHLNFGLHVEHHLFPSMSSKYAPLVRDELVRLWPERYQSLPLMTAMVQLASTPRVYITDTTLVDPRTGQQSPTIVPRESAAEAHAEADAHEPPTAAQDDVIDAA